MSQEELAKLSMLTYLKKQNKVNMDINLQKNIQRVPKVMSQMTSDLKQAIQIKKTDIKVFDSNYKFHDSM